MKMKSSRSIFRHTGKLNQVVPFSGTLGMIAAPADGLRLGESPAGLKGPGPLSFSFKAFSSFIASKSSFNSSGVSFSLHFLWSSGVKSMIFMWTPWGLSNRGGMGQTWYRTLSPFRGIYSPSMSEMCMKTGKVSWKVWKKLVKSTWWCGKTLQSYLLLGLLILTK